ncbi:hypothetical protein Acsp06_64160 [Actinomycetospora sp. NBRC 106375]|uniref:hypothetical protein n=1 Tax=Actinomycetospora sp. NBRC 106375 TaxID=3032207 RepID=UPI0024A1D843|nr:hypothetical protein [Actinomycetospora sp. NBRC 106375]GLZ50231.1 hypothetical protein Acsp06_64160 [Actinomycetospora sp. NBRC 106375]
MAAGLELVCTQCGGEMRKAVTAPLGMVTSASASPPPVSSPGRPRRRRRGGDSCDAAVRLTEPNPFTAEIRRAHAAGDPSSPEG